jgi:UDP-glucuronate 4-epimerase
MDAGALAAAPGRPLRVVVTGGAGFIGSHLCERLLRSGHAVWAVDSFDDFYDPARKRDNVRALAGHASFRLVDADVCDGAATEAALAPAGAVAGEIDVVVHLAARAGVRPSIEQPALYARVNVEGTAAVLELARRLRVPAFVFGSSSSVYGNAAPVPFSEADPVAAPISPYAATKRAGELLAHTYHHLYGLSVVSLRFFTVYGPRQRPDLAIHKFARLMWAGEEIPVFGDGSTRRDYTYVDDIVQGVERAIGYALAHPGCHEVFNLGESDTVTLSRLIDLLSGALGVEPRLRRLPPQPGDVERTCADISRARALLGYAPTTRIEDGIPRFVEWFRASVGG